MNYHEARQRSDGAGWAWTTMNDGEVRTSGGCVTWPEGPPASVEEALAGTKPIGDPHAHPTREEAERCFYEHERGQLHETAMPSDVQRRCDYPDCTNWTQGGLAARYLGEADLCHEHRHADGWSVVHPFHPPIAITASW